MSNKYCQALVELRNKPAHELKEVGDQWRTPDNIFYLGRSPIMSRTGHPGWSFLCSSLYL